MSTQNSSYVIEILEDKTISHLYYGKKIKSYRGSKKYIYMDRGFSPNPAGQESDYSYDTIPQEFPTNGNGDFRIPAYQTLEKNGSTVTNFKYIDYSIIDGKPSLSGLPHTHATEEKKVKTLVIHAKDMINGLKVNLNYSIFYHSDVITRSVEFINEGNETIKLQKALSMNIDFRDPDFEMITLYGKHNNERNLVRRKIVPGIQGIESTRFSSSAHQAPFVALVKEHTNEEQGEVYAFSLVYSGNFSAQVQLDSYETTRFNMGINPYNFSWTLESNEKFSTPEVVMHYTDNGLGEMSRKLHDFTNEHLLNGHYKHKTRPVLLNNWEATYLDFDEEKILDLAQKSKDLGIELFVLDDGWFGERNDLNSGLGDWIPNKKKLPNGLDKLSTEIKNMGLKFGLWFEPEMVSPNSELYEKHPEWCIGIPNRPKSLGRKQYVLDLTQKDVRKYIYDSISSILDNTSIDYIKWDMNRNITEAWSLSLPAERQQEFGHRYMLGLYEILEKITTEYPKVLFENVSSGGGRYDLGMMYYMPQSWTSDNTDAIGRLEIQKGTSYVYPTVTMGAHVSTTPNHQVGRNTSLQTRGIVAMAGNLGYELDVTKLSANEETKIKEQIEFYKENKKLIQFGDLYRLETHSSNEYAWLKISKNKDEFLATYVKILSLPGASIRSIKLNGLDEDALYKNVETGEVFGGDELVHSGLSIPRVKQDFHSQIWKFKKIKEENE